MARKLDGSKSIQSGTITSTQLSSSVTASIEAGGGPRISGLIYPGDDTAANTVGGQTIYLTGSGFDANAEVYINGSAVPSVSFISASNVGFTTPALSAATYPVYLINPDDGATAILVPGISISGEPTWVTSATLAEQDASGTWNISLSATGDETITYALATGSSLPGGITLASNGVISGTITTPPETDTTYNFTVDAIDAQNQSSSRAFSVTATTGEGVLFANNVLLIHADGTNNGNNHSFLDSSNNNFTITRFGNATQGSYSPFSQTGWSAYFDGSGDYLTVPDNAAWDYGTGDFTIECWTYQTSIGTNVILVGQYSGNDGSSLEVLANNKVVFWAESAYRAYSANTVSANKWNHIAVSRSGTNLRLFLNGVLETTVTNSTDISGSTAALHIGSSASTPGAGLITGYMSNVRVVKGTAVYTAAFVPPTAPLTPIANTQLLILQSNRLIDDGPNNFAITRAGDVSVQAFSPFAPGLLSSNSHSVYFDGSSDYIQTPTSASLAFGSGDFTIEMWMYPTAKTQSYPCIYSNNVGFGTNWLSINYDHDSNPKKIRVFSYNLNSSTPILISANQFQFNSWYHVAVSRSGNSFKLFVNGVEEASATLSGSVDGGSSHQARIGSGPTTSSDEYAGFISNVRIIKGTAVYTGAFTPSTSPLTAVSNTSLLTCQSTTFVDNSTNAFTITPNGNASPRKFNPFGQNYTTQAYSTANVGGSVYMDGSGDYISFPDNTAFDLGTSDFTYETWFYTNTVSGVQNILSLDVSSYPAVLIQLDGAAIKAYASTGALAWDVLDALSGGTVTARQWYHFALTRSGSTFRTFLNGTLIASTTSSSSIEAQGTAGRIGLSEDQFSQFFNGYMSNCRLIKGNALYTSSFTPPAAPLTNVANTQLLLNFTNAQIFDQTAKNVLETVGDAKVSTAQYKYGTGSMYFDGTGDYLVTPSAAVNTLAGDFTVEMWVYRSAGNNFFFTLGDSVGSTGFDLYIGNTGANLRLYSGNSVVIDNALSSVNFPTSTWTHIALVRSSGSVRMYVAGMQAGSAWSSTAVFSGRVYVGAEFYNGSITGTCNGYMDDVRVTNGIARYVANFTPPTAKFKDK